MSNRKNIFSRTDSSIDLLREGLQKAKSLLRSRPVTRDDHCDWERMIRDSLGAVFGADSHRAAKVIQAGHDGTYMPLDNGEGRYDERRAKSLVRQIKCLEKLIDDLVSSSGPTRNSEATERVALVCDQEGRFPRQVARFLRHLNLEVVIKSTASESYTLIESLEENSSVSFAIALVSNASDCAEDPSWQEMVRPSMHRIDLGLAYFAGRIGKSRICTLQEKATHGHEGHGLAGVSCIDVDDRGNWRLELAKNMKLVGMSIDMNKAL